MRWRESQVPGALGRERRNNDGVVEGETHLRLERREECPQVVAANVARKSANRDEKRKELSFHFR
jgi:hypothetical protein